MVFLEEWQEPPCFGRHFGLQFVIICFHSENKYDEETYGEERMCIFCSELAGSATCMNIGPCFFCPGREYAGCTETNDRAPGTSAGRCEASGSWRWHRSLLFTFWAADFCHLVGRDLGHKQHMVLNEAEVMRKPAFLTSLRAWSLIADMSYESHLEVMEGVTVPFNSFISLRRQH